MYYPKSHITPDLYSNGEYLLKNTTEVYTGYYFSTFDNKYFTGKYPNDGKNLELVEISPNARPFFEFRVSIIVSH